MKTIPKYQNLVELFQVRSGQEPHSPLYFFSKTGLVKDNEEVTYQRFENKVKSIAALIQQYTSQGDRVLLICEPGMDYTLAYWACLYAGVLSIPAYPPVNLNTIEKLQSIIANAEPTLIISNLNVIQTVKRLGLLKTMADNPFLKILLEQFTKSSGEGLEWDFKRFRWISINKADEVPSSSWQPRSIKPDDTAFLQYTSGSTAMPKGVMVTHANILANLELVHRTIKQNPDDRMVSWLPPYHDMGLIGNLLFPVYCQFPIMIMSPISFLRNPYLWVRAISDFKATISGGPNFAYELCAKKFNISHVEKDMLDLSQWRVAYNGAEPINLKTLDDFTEKFAPFGFKSHAYYPIYGLAEATVYVSGAKAGTAAAELLVDREELKKDRVVLAENGSKKNQVLVGCGQPLVPLRIVKKDTHELCKDAEVGEIWIGGDCITKGYWGRDEETRACFGWTIKDYPDDYYLRTGDLGFVLHGILYVTGRIKDLIIINGKNYYPQDIELVTENTHNLIRTHGVAAFSAFGEDKEELVIVAELKKPETAEIYEEILKEIYEQVNVHCGVLPNRIVLIAPKTLPKTTSGKLRRSDTRKMLEDNTLEILFKWALPSG